MQFGPLIEPKASRQGKATPWPISKLKFWGFLTGPENDRNLSFRAFKVGVARHVNLWGPSA